MPEPDVCTGKMISLLTDEVSEQVRGMRIEYAAWEGSIRRGYPALLV